MLQLCTLVLRWKEILSPMPESCYFFLFSCEMQSPPALVTVKTLSPAVCKDLKEELSIR